jgi:alpha-1,3-glucosyltransferase
MALLTASSPRRTRRSQQAASQQAASQQAASSAAAASSSASSSAPSSASTAAHPSHTLPLLLCLLPLLPRLLLLASSFSGSSLSAYSSPNKGDYEAHRKWLSLTASLPAARWYTHELEYWGCDYPPLCLFLHRALSLLVPFVAPKDTDLLDLNVRGYEGKVENLRALHIAAEYSFALPSLLLLLSSEPRAARYPLAALVLAAPLLPLVDHGHFQISNGVPLSLTFLALHFLSSSPDPPPRAMSLSAVLFTCSLLTKQMSLYFAPVFFCYMLSWSLRPPAPSLKLSRFLHLALPVLATALLSFLPFPPPQWPHILSRIFPFQRGLFESKVSSLWCALDTYPLDVRRRLSAGKLQKLSLLATVAAVLPACGAAYVRAERASGASERD